jgi:hypothetical protein
MRTSNVWSLLVLLAMAVAPVEAREQQQRPLPAFTVMTPGGAPAPSRQLSTEQRWLLLYVSPGCRSCDQLLAALKEWHTPQLAARTVIVVRANPADAAEFVASRLPAEASDVSWYVDSTSAAWQALALTGAPVLVGVESGQIKWSISGVLNDPSALEPVVRSWIEY